MSMAMRQEHQSSFRTGGRRRARHERYTVGHVRPLPPRSTQRPCRLAKPFQSSAQRRMTNCIKARDGDAGEFCHG
jgi:hypothetical protein